MKQTNMNKMKRAGPDASLSVTGSETRKKGIRKTCEATLQSVSVVTSLKHFHAELGFAGRLVHPALQALSSYKFRTDATIKCGR
jgi:hypothetical protein